MRIVVIGRLQPGTEKLKLLAVDLGRIAIQAGMLVLLLACLEPALDVEMRPLAHVRFDDFR